MVIHYWTRASGIPPVQKFILKQVPDLRQRMLKSIDVLESDGMRLIKEPNVLKQMKSAPVLHELKSRSNNLQGRILLTVIRDEAWLLDAFVKSDPQKTDLSIKKSLNRRKDLIVN